MAIRFPRVNIATSVVNRILNLNDALNAGMAMKQGGADGRGLPTMASDDGSGSIGPQIDQALSTPPAPSDAAPDTAEAVALKGLV